ncbi:unnamed protein product, partial [Iphiclides podalirius]
MEMPYRYRLVKRKSNNRTSPTLERVVRRRSGNIENSEESRAQWCAIGNPPKSREPEAPQPPRQQQISLLQPGLGPTDSQIVTIPFTARVVHHLVPRALANGSPAGPWQMSPRAGYTRLRSSHLRSVR